MKRLLIYLGLLATLLAMPYHAKADNTWAYYLVGDFNNYAVESNYKFGDTSNTDDKPSFTVTLTGAQLDPNGDGTAKIRIGVILNDNTADGYYLSHNNYGVTMSRDTQYGVTSKKQTNSLIINGISRTGSYTFTFVSGEGSLGPDTRNQGTLSVSGPEVYAEETNLTIITNAKNSWSAFEYDSYDGTKGYYNWTITKEDIEAANISSGNNVEFKLKIGSTYYGLPSGSRVVGTSWSANMTTDNNAPNAYFSYNNQILSYKIQAKYDGANWHVRVIPTYSTWYLHSNLDNDWTKETTNPLTYNSETGFYETTLDRTKILSASNDDVRFRIYDIAKGSWGPSSTYQFTSTSRTGHTATWLNDSPYYSIPKTYNDNNVTFAKIEANYTDDMLVQVFVTLTMEAIEPHDYYWVSPQVTNNQKLPSFKMVASRNRSGEYGDGLISTRYFSFTMKADDIKNYDGTAISNGEKVQWYIVRDDNEVWYRPTSDDPTPTDENSSLDGDANIGYRNFNDCKTTSSSTTGCFSFLKGYSGYNTSSNNAVSYTFILNAQKTSNPAQGNVYFNYAKGAAPITDYYLIGNFRSASETEYIDISDTSHPMTKYWYKDGVEYTSEVASADSIVYKIQVSKPAGGWGNLYLDVNPSGNTTNDAAHWANVYRPLISLGNNLDGRALVGGVTKASTHQSLNPETSDKYTGYTFSFNATTYTYRLEFHTSLYLVGPGVSSSEGLGSWNMSNVGTSDPRIRLTATQEAGHYRNRVYFTQGQEFRFIQNTDEAAPDYSTTWHENNNAPKWMTAISDGEYTPGSETQYKNSLDFQNGTGSTDNTAPSGTSVTFDLPTGWYYVNFYENSGGTPYYTIERQIDLRDFNEVKYSNGGIVEQRNILYRGDYNFFRVWSDHIAWAKPDDIDVFVVTAFSVNANGQATVTLTKQNGNYIPAKTGVILASTETKSSFSGGIVYKEALSGTSYNTAWMDMTPADAPATTYSGTTMLTPLYDATNLQRFINDGGTDYANYLFGFYRLNKVISNYSGENNDFGLGFWLTTGVGNTYANSAFVRILKSDAEKMGVGTAYDNIESASRAFAPAFMLLFDESDDNVITGISDITTAKGNSVASQGWYTLQGVRTPKPTQRGIYIYNGKKVIVND